MQRGSSAWGDLLRARSRREGRLVARVLLHTPPRPPPHRSTSFDFVVDFDGRAGDGGRVDALLAALTSLCTNVTLSPAALVPWFPLHARDIDRFSSKTLDAGAELESDHPGFSDVEYRQRRTAIVEAASAYRYGARGGARGGLVIVALACSLAGWLAGARAGASYGDSRMYPCAEEG